MTHMCTYAHAHFYKCMSLLARAHSIGEVSLHSNFMVTHYSRLFWPNSVIGVLPTVRGGLDLSLLMLVCTQQNFQYFHTTVSLIPTHFIIKFSYNNNACRLTYPLLNSLYSSFHLSASTSKSHTRSPQQVRQQHHQPPPHPGKSLPQWHQLIQLQWLTLTCVGTGMNTGLTVEHNYICTLVQCMSKIIMTSYSTTCCKATDVKCSPGTMRAPCDGEEGSLSWPSVEYHTVKEVCNASATYFQLQWSTLMWGTGINTGLNIYVYALLHSVCQKIIILFHNLLQSDWCGV